MLTSPMSTLLEQVQSVIGAGVDTIPFDNTLLGSRVRVRRISRGISQQELCAKLEIKGHDLSAYESGEKRINANLLFRIAKLLDVRPDFFFRPSPGEDAKTA
jgi:transcriptional regulator with XRE-family HTH domain